MICEGNEAILFIEPSKEIDIEPVLDELTKKMAAALDCSEKGAWCGNNIFEDDCWLGLHVCACGAESRSVDFKLPNGQFTNSLATHYLAYHRKDVPEAELAKVRALDFGESDTAPVKPGVIK
jgi:hypothetical protein